MDHQGPCVTTNTYGRLENGFSLNIRLKKYQNVKFLSYSLQFAKGSLQKKKIAYFETMSQWRGGGVKPNLIEK